MNNNKISVIVPVYKTETYLDRCIENIVNQTYNNLEIILVDDGSPDNCPEICDNWAARDSRIKVIHKENGGVSSARNAGLDAATGDYIGFVDGDDYPDSDMYSYLLSGFDDAIDIVRCTYRKIYENETVEEIANSGETAVKSSADFLNDLLLDNSINSNCWCKLYRRSVIGDVHFPLNIAIGEDHLFNYQVIKNSRKIMLCSCSKYNYLIRNDSVTNLQNNIGSWIQNISIHKMIFEKELNGTAYIAAATAYANWVLDAIGLCVKSGSYGSEYSQLNTELKQSFNLLKKIDLNKKLKLKLLTARYFRKAYKLLLKKYFEKEL